MKKVVIIPDSYKGTLLSSEICFAMSEKILEYYPDCETISIPVADGGEGSVDAYLQAVGGEKISCHVGGPHLEEVEAYYGILKDGKTAIIEMAVCSGLSLVGDNKNPSNATTYGVGQLIRHALDHDVEDIILAIGGSATNDGGCGMAAALGVEFFDEAGKQMIPTGESLRLIEQIRFNHLHPRIKSTTFIAMCDTTNPLCGQNGASVVFGPQKGADETMVGELDLGLMHLADIIEELLGIDFRNIGGTGAGGGLGFGALVFLGGILQSGIETFLQIVDFDALAGGADLIFTGEGKIDKQSLQGKVIDGVTSHSKKLGIPVIVIAGDIGEGIEDFYSKGVAAILSTNRIAAPYNQIISRAKSDISLTLDTFLRIFNLCKRIN